MSVTLEPIGADEAIVDDRAIIGMPGEPPVSDFAPWRSWMKVNRRRFRALGHGGAWVDVHVEPRFARTYAEGAPDRALLLRPWRAPDGLRVVQAAYADEAGGRLIALTAMAKMDETYDPLHGDWYYAVLDESGALAYEQGPLERCATCHARADRDHLFGLDREATEARSIRGRALMTQ